MHTTARPGPPSRYSSRCLITGWIITSLTDGPIAASAAALRGTFVGVRPYHSASPPVIRPCKYADRSHQFLSTIYPPAAFSRCAPAGASAAALADTFAGTGSYSIPRMSLISANMPTGLTFIFYVRSPPPTRLARIPLYPGPRRSPKSLSWGRPTPRTVVFNQVDWPARDVVPPTVVQRDYTRMKSSSGWDTPDFSPTKDGSCAGDPAAAAQAEQRGWWTGPSQRREDCKSGILCGTRLDEILPYSKIWQYHGISATFSVVGSRVISWPENLIAECMASDEISVHTVHTMYVHQLSSL
ncbi:hypothetical protein C8Q74DRAFT_1215802 [Fomes fomentarius]|nr:hypothetical protein C8Q74DRAFT_1215802 [Fomes fomentarius]